MLVKFSENGLARMASVLAFTGGFAARVVTSFRGRIQLLRAAPGEAALKPLQSMRLRRRGSGKHSMRVTDGWELVLVFEAGEDGRVAVVEALVETTTTKTEGLS